MITKSKNFNENYCANIVEIKNFLPHSNADKLKIAIVNFQRVITSIDAEPGLYVFFPAGSCLSTKFLGETNSFRDETLNIDNTKKGMFDKNARVRAIRLRGEQSEGYIVPIKVLEDFSGLNLSDSGGQTFDTLGEDLLVKKHVPSGKQQGLGGNKKQPTGFDRLVDGQVRLHTDTTNFRNNYKMFSLDEEVSITYKFHGTSGWISNVLTKKKPTLSSKLLKFFGVYVNDKVYDIIYGSRKVIKNRYIEDSKEEKPKLKVDVWEEAAEKFKLAEKLPKGYTLYYEIVGYLPGTSSMIQKDYDYGLAVGDFKVYVYRITFTNTDGHVFDLNTKDCLKFCRYYDLDFVPLLFNGTLLEYGISRNIPVYENVEAIVEQLQKEYNEKDCYICKNKVPEEGIVIRRENEYTFQAFKLKSFRFLELETKEADAELVNIEDEN